MSRMKRWMEDHAMMPMTEDITGQPVTLEPDIFTFMDKHKPEGATWCTFRIGEDGFPNIHGPFDTFDEAFTWTLANNGTVQPLFSP